MTRGRVAWLLMAPLLCAIVIVAWRAEWRSCPSVDCRTYVEMFRGISLHGAPYLENGPIELYPELRARWNVVHDGRLWGTYPPVFPYVASIPFMLGGLAGVAHFNGLMLGVLALGAFALGRRYTGDPLVGTAAAYLSTLSTPASSASFDLGPYIMAVTTTTWAAFFTVWALDEVGRKASRLAFLAGLAGGLALGTHLLNFPISASMVLVLFVAPSSYAELAPTRASLRRGAWGLVGMAIPLAFMACLNRVRFGSFNPISYGPCPWTACEEAGLKNQSAAIMLQYAAPTILWSALSLVGLWLTRGSRRGIVITLVVSAAVLAAYAPLRQRTGSIGAILVSYVFDNGLFAMEPMQRPEDGLGNLFGPFVIKSVLQGTPFLALALLAPIATRREKVTTLAIGLPALALFIVLGLRANLAPVQALGYSFLYFRYALPALPLLAVLGLGAVRKLPWRWKHVVLAVVFTLSLVWVLAQAPDDGPYWRRFILLRGSLVLGVLALVLTWLGRHRSAPPVAQAATLLTVMAIGCGLGINLGVDLSATHAMQVDGARRVDRFAAYTPQRFALVGWPQEIDVLLPLRASRDIEYADLYESVNFWNFRQLIEQWTREQRPIFAVFPPGYRNPWPDVEVTLVDEELRLSRVTLH